jgi:hypothetical protein
MAPHLSLPESTSHSCLGKSSAPGPHFSKTPPSAERPATALTLSECDGKRIAVVLGIEGKRQVLRGVGHWSYHPTLGNALRIPIDGDQGCASEILLAEESWRGEAALDNQYGCEVRITLF